MTTRLYYEDSHLRDFDAVVTSCEPRGDSFALTLDRSAFYPQGGGQDADGGLIGDARVLDVQEEGNALIHFTDKPLEKDARLRCLIDWDTRFRRMQNHSGEHIISGTVNRLFGLNNVGFHMNGGTITLDFDGELGAEDIDAIEHEANDAIYRNIPVTAQVLRQQELARAEYRSKTEFSGDVRLITIEGVDCCACCAPHVARTGEIGLIKILDYARHRGGMRLTAACGADAMDDYRERFNSTVAVSRALSAKQSEIADAVERTLAALEAAQIRAKNAQRRLVERMIDTTAQTDGNLCFFESELDPVILRELVNAGMELCGGVCVAFCGTDGEYTYIIGSRSIDLRARAGEINAAISGRGGGSPTMIQGSSRGTRADIEAFFKSWN